MKDFIAKQQETVRWVEMLFALADQIKVRFDKARAQVDKLTLSILACNLIPQDFVDEQVSTLLEHVKADKNGLH